MPSWEDLMNCVCQNNGPQRPGVQEVLDTLQRSTVCTGTQCFETEADAFGLVTAPQGAQGTPASFYMMMAYVPYPTRAAYTISPTLGTCDKLSFATDTPCTLPAHYPRFMMLVAIMLKLKQKQRSPAALTEKPGTSSSHSNEPPPPPVS